MKLGQGYVFTGVCDSVHMGVCLSTCWDTTPPKDQAPTWEQTPPEQTPRSRPPPGVDTPQLPSSTEHAGRYGQRAGGTHPTGMQSCCLNFDIRKFDQK